MAQIGTPAPQTPVPNPFAKMFPAGQKLDVESLLTANPTGEPTYSMRGSNGKTLQVPFTMVGLGQHAGYQIDGAEREAYRNRIDEIRRAQDPGYVLSLNKIGNPLIGAAHLLGNYIRPVTEEEKKELPLPYADPAMLGGMRTAKQVLTPIVDNLKQAWQAHKEHNTDGVITHLISATPVLGQVMDRAEDQLLILEGDTNNGYWHRFGQLLHSPGSLGTLTGGALTLGAPVATGVRALGGGPLLAGAGEAVEEGATQAVRDRGQTLVDDGAKLHQMDPNDLVPEVTRKIGAETGSYLGNKTGMSAVSKLGKWVGGGGGKLAGKGLAQIPAVREAAANSQTLVGDAMIDAGSQLKDFEFPDTTGAGKTFARATYLNFANQDRRDDQDAAPTTGRDRWVANGVDGLTRHLAQDNSTGLDSENLKQLQQSEAGRVLLTWAGDLTPGSKAMQGVANDAKKLLNSQQTDSQGQQ